MKSTRRRKISKKYLNGGGAGVSKSKCSVYAEYDNNRLFMRNCCNNQDIRHMKQSELEDLKKRCENVKKNLTKKSEKEKKEEESVAFVDYLTSIKLGMLLINHKNQKPYFGFLTKEQQAEIAKAFLNFSETDIKNYGLLQLRDSIMKVDVWPTLRAILTVKNINNNDPQIFSTEDFFPLFKDAVINAINKRKDEMKNNPVHLTLNGGGRFSCKYKYKNKQTRQHHKKTQKQRHR